MVGPYDVDVAPYVVERKKDERCVMLACEGPFQILTSSDTPEHGHPLSAAAAELRLDHRTTTSGLSLSSLSSDVAVSHRELKKPWMLMNLTLWDRICHSR